MTTLCTVCRKKLPEVIVGSDVAHHFVYDRVDYELKYIELAHDDCAKADNLVLSPRRYWNISLEVN